MTIRDGTVPQDVVLAFHGGSFDFFDLGKPADEALRRFATEQATDGFVEKMAAVDSSGRVDRAAQRTWRSGLYSGTSAVLDLTDPWVDPSRHRYLSFLSAIKPSDDAFVGNDNPMRYEIFDAQGNFLGPFSIDIYGSDVLDAGVRANEEADVLWLDRNLDEVDFEAGTRTSAPILPHPGFNGSYANPEAQPKRILGGSFEWVDDSGSAPRVIADYVYDPELADFSRPGAKLFRITVTSGAHEGFNGTYYDRSHSGEGMTVEIFRSAGKPFVLFSWYTYRPDGSGEPVYLSGIAPIGKDYAFIDLAEFRGGRFGWLENEANVEGIPWGRIGIEFVGVRCSQIRLIALEPNDAAWYPPPYPDPIPPVLWERALPNSSSMDRLCTWDLVPFEMFP